MSLDFLITTLIVLGTLIVPLVLAWLLGKWLRMENYIWRLSVMFLAISVASITVVFGYPNARLGIDLRGGVNLVYAYEPLEEEALDFNVDEKLIGPIRKRIDPSGLEELTVREYGEGQIEIIMPAGDEADAERLKDKIRNTGTLAFQIVATPNRNLELIQRARDLRERGVTDIKSEDGESFVAEWVPVANTIGPDGKAVPRLGGDPEGESSPYFFDTSDDELEVLLLTLPPDQRVTGEHLASIAPSIGNEGWQVSFQMNAVGSQRLGNLTGENLPEGNTKRQMAIILDGKVYSAPGIEDQITDQGRISGRFTEQEVNDLVSVLRAGSLSATLAKEPLKEEVTGPLLGYDVIWQSGLALGIAMTLVLVFMVVYYRFAGLLACMAMLLNLLFVVAMMFIINAVFTLPGIAGLVLTVGMAIDANVLIYERLREELDRGSTLRMAIRNGYGRATTTIIDANLTTLITATVLYIIGTDQIKGFAVTLALGIALSMFTAIFCTRVVFDIAERKRWVKDLNMMRLFGSTSFNFLGARRAALAASAVLILLGLVAAGIQGRNILDIDFLGGSSVQIRFDEPRTIAEVRDVVSEFYPDASVRTVRSYTDAAGGELGVFSGQAYAFVIDTLANDVDEVERRLAEAFKGQLTHNSVMIADLEEIPVGEGPEPPQPDRSNDAQLEKPAEPASGPALQPPQGEPEPTPPADDEQPSPTEESPAEQPDPAQAAAGDEQSSLFSADDFRSLAGLGAGRWAMLPTTLLWQDEPTTNPDQPAEEAPAEETTGEEPQQPATEEQPADEPMVKAETDSEEEFETEVPGGQEPMPTPEVDPQPVDPESRFNGGTATKLVFDQSVAPEFIIGVIREELSQQGVSVEQPYPWDLDNLAEGETDDQPAREWRLRLAVPPSIAGPVLETLKEQAAAEPYFPFSSEIGGQVAAGSQRQALAAIAISLIFIVAYVWFRFHRVSYGLAAVVALVHDVLFMLGALALTHYVARIPGMEAIFGIQAFKINLAVVAAFLTVIGYSLNDTIVVFDRVREVKGKSPYLTMDMLNQSLNQTLSRTVLTALTTLIVVLILFFAGVETIKGFAFALVVGVVVGTYSSVYIACPVLVWLGEVHRTAAAPASALGKQASGTTTPSASKKDRAGV